MSLKDDFAAVAAALSPEEVEAIVREEAADIGNAEDKAKTPEGCSDAEVIRAFAEASIRMGRSLAKRLNIQDADAFIVSTFWERTKYDPEFDAGLRAHGRPKVTGAAVRAEILRLLAGGE